MRTVLTRPPGPAITRCELTFMPRHPIDAGAAAAEHRALERALADLGCRVVRLPPLDDQPDAAFVEDVAVVLDEVAIVTRPGSPSRRPETDGMEAVLAPFRPVRTITAPGTLDGGDVLRRGRRLYVGRSGRTNDEGIEQLRAAVAPWNYRVSAVAVEGCLHLKTAACAVAGDVLLVNPAWVDAGALGDGTVLEVDAAEPFAANAIALDGVVLTADGHPRMRRMLESRGIEVRVTPLRELSRAEAGVTCCCLVIEDR